MIQATSFRNGQHVLAADGHNLVDLLAEKIKVVVLLNKTPLALLVDGLAFTNC